ncbi:MAG: DUF4249 family protein [Candidatus Marinimicrobia bacterium]|nr:DUF4249 family protein [Candidatus Neomarinimicrobiota bacterium]MCF7922686.1 DUF4249 family protein [Candidatus Neomarinimicrobiota bacterium]
MKYLKILFSILSAVIIFNCDLPHQPGPMPTEIVATEFEPGLNILGVLRADGVTGTSFININRALTTEEIYSDTIENFSPEVDYVKVSSISSGSEYQFIRAEDTTDWGNYRDSTLNVVAGEVYDLEISAPGFPTLSGHTTIPNQPHLVANSLHIEVENISFEIDHHVSAYEYKLYLIFADTILDKVVKPANGNSISVDWTFDMEYGAPLYLMLSALDENLTRFGNSPISFIPNTYHPDGSTVDGGYGCFGSVAITLINLN